MYSMFIALYRIDGIYGHFGRGHTSEDAIKALKRAGGRWSQKAIKEDRCVLWHFTSELPFVPIGDPRKAKKSEADAYVAKSGDLCWVRCERTKVELDRGTSRYFTHGHNVEGCLRNGSYVRQDGIRFVQYMNGDYIGDLAAVPASMTEVESEKAKRLLPKCCK